MEPLENLGYKFYVVRRYFGYNQENVAHHFGVSKEAYSKIERGITKVSLAHLKKFSNLFHLQVGDLLTLDADELILKVISDKLYGNDHKSLT